MCNYYVFVARRLGEADAHVDELRSNQVEALRLLSAEVAQRSFEEEARQQPGCSRRFERSLYPSHHPPATTATELAVVRVFTVYQHKCVKSC